MIFHRSEQLFDRAQRRISGGVNSPSRSYAAVGGGAPAFIARGEGAYLYDVDGNRYIDYLAAYGAMILGHRNLDVLFDEWILDERRRQIGIVEFKALRQIDGEHLILDRLGLCHLSNPAAREDFRRHTYVSLAATGLVSGFGAKSYELAVEAAAGLAR